MLWKDSNTPERSWRIADLIDIFYLIVGIGVSVGPVLMGAVAIAAVAYLGSNYNPN